MPDTTNRRLREIYERALIQSIDLVIVSAYLTEWDSSIPLGKKCKSFRLIVGKDFGITRKKACLEVMKWLPKCRLAQFRVADQITGFHPKAVFWSEDGGKYFALVGSSNLSKAAFESNHEINGYASIDKSTFEAVKDWVAEVTKKSVVVSESWLAKYVEAIPPKRPSGTKGAPTTVFNLSLPKPRAKVRLAGLLANRREQMKVFREKRADLEALFRDTARQPWSSAQGTRFYASLNKLWAHGTGGSRFQGAGWDRSGRSSNFKELARSVVAVLDCDEYERDDIVSSEIDRLRKKKVSTRSALFSEMLCQFFPTEFPVLDGPVKEWLKQTNFFAPRRASEGARYVDLAVKLRAALRQSKDSQAKNLAELDVVIWLVNQLAKEARDAKVLPRREPVSSRTSAAP